MLTLENIDILVLMETHTVSLRCSHRVQILEQSGLAAKAGVAIITKAGARWDVLNSEVVVPGYAVMVQVSHHMSRESFWILGVYGDISGGQASLVRFYERLHLCLSMIVR